MNKNIIFSYILLILYIIKNASHYESPSFLINFFIYHYAKLKLKMLKHFFISYFLIFLYIKYYMYYVFILILFIKSFLY